MIDHERILKMFTVTGINQANIARRLECSEKTVQRIVNGHERNQTRVNEYLDTEYEHMLWQMYSEDGYGYGAIAYLFGVTRQAVSRAAKIQTIL